MYSWSGPTGIGVEQELSPFQQRRARNAKGQGGRLELLTRVRWPARLAGIGLKAGEDAGDAEGEEPVAGGGRRGPRPVAENALEGGAGVHGLPLHLARLRIERRHRFFLLVLDLG